MNNTRETLKEEARSKLQTSFSELSAELNKLQAQGLLTNLDRKKIVADAEVSAQAIRDALERTDYPEALQRELVMRLITQFESTIKDVAAKARNKVSDTKLIYQKLSEIEKIVLRNSSMPVERQAYLETADWNRVRDSYVRRIRKLNKSKKLDTVQINYAYQDYRSACRNYLSQFTPRISPGVGGDIDPSHNTQQSQYSQPIIPQASSSGNTHRDRKSRPRFHVRIGRLFKRRDRKISTGKRKKNARLLLIFTILFVVLCYLCLISIVF